MVVIKPEMVVKGHQAFHDFWGRQSSRPSRSGVATCAAGEDHPTWHSGGDSKNGRDNGEIGGKNGKKMEMIRGIRHLTTFGGGKICSQPRAPITHAAQNINGVANMEHLLPGDYRFSKSQIMVIMATPPVNVNFM